MQQSSRDPRRPWEPSSIGHPRQLCQCVRESSIVSILNRASDGLFNMVVVLHKTLLYEGSMNRDKLLALVAPASVSEDRKWLRNSQTVDGPWTVRGVDGKVRSRR